jgi:Ala-tRNA(Pro) deacylase
MSNRFHLFGTVHLLILASVPTIAILLSIAARHSRASAHWTRYTLGSLLALNELAWYAYRLHFEGFRFPEGLPLELCDLTLWLTVFALFTLNPIAFEIAYFAGVGGSGMALLTPDLWAPLASYPSIYFFGAHGMVVVCLLMLLWSKQARPRPGSPWKVFAVVNIYAAAIAVFNAIFDTNYMYLCQKPAGASIIDFLGPWPVYLFGCEALSLAIFWLLWLPIRFGRVWMGGHESARTTERGIIMLTAKLKEFLDANQVKYSVLTHPTAYTAPEIASLAHVPGQDLAKTVIVKIDDHFAMAVLPSSRHVDLLLLKASAYAKTIRLVAEEEFRDLFPGCEIGAMPPFGNLYGMPVFIDESLTKNAEIAFNAGTHTELIRLAYRDFARLVQPTVIGFAAKAA